MKARHEASATTEKPSMDPTLFPQNIMKEGGVETLESNVSSQKGFQRQRGQHSNPWNHFMTGIESSSVLPVYSSSKRKSGWFIFLTCLVLLFATTRYYDPRNVRGISSRLFGPGYESRIVELSSDSNTTGIGSRARTDQVQFDNYSLILRGQRIFLHSGEFHTFRLPVPSLWPDILEKIKAAGMNAVSVYTHMGLINPAPGVIDFEGFRALQPLYDAAKAAGIWIVLRPGPYINAETTAGGIAHWATSEVAGQLRTNSSDWSEAWQAYIQGIIKVTVPNQISAGGPVIAIQVDNEYTQNPVSHAGYFAELEAAYAQSDVVVPLTYNDPGEGRNFINGTGAVDLYGMDSYPQGFDCSHPTVWKPAITNYQQYHAEVNPSQPWYIPEFQGGSYDAWGPTAPGYGPCRVLTGPDFQSVFNLQLWASNAKLINYYMFYGGTSWGAIPFPGVYTSYDYGASLTESRELTPKYDELKRQSLFLRSSPEFYKTDWIADSSTGLRVSSNGAAFITLLRNPDTTTAFYIARQADSTSTATTTFKLNVTVAGASLQIPVVATAITLGGRQSKLIVTDYSFGASSKLSYSTAQIFYASTIDNRDVLFLYGDSSQEHEVALRLTGTPNKLHNNQSCLVQISTNSPGLTEGITMVNFLPGIEGLITVWDSDTQLVLFADSETTATFWSPVLAGKSDDPLRNFWGLGTNQSILVGGPYLVRDASLVGSKLALRGDLKTDVRLTVIAPKGIKSITWNDENVSGDLAASSTVTQFGGFVGQLGLRKAVTGIKVPKLSWKYKDSLPEIQNSFNDDSWTIANRTTTNVPLKPYYGDGRILYGCDYGFCENVVLWRGHFKATGFEKSLNLSINGGEAFAASVWANEVFLGTSFGNSTNNRNILEETDDKFIFPTGALRVGEDNVITVVQDNMGLNETQGQNTDSSKGPRGIRGFALENNTFTEWKVQGKVGGYKNYPDKVRGVLNEGGLFGERKGWHLPSFSTSGWASRDLSEGLPNKAAGVGFFVSTFKLDIPRGLDVMMSFTFEEPFGQPYRAFLFVNGWMMGKRVANLGPQAKFPVHEGILDYHGENTVAVALWAMEPNVTISPIMQLTLDAVYDGGVGNIVTNNPKWLPVGKD
ncbi:glycoside hydrolase family 35 protein [Hebeloma cylindrosporum]|uniref:beta-galactosidase n=1 Tax=Hebeloma cylindrosporum TaxID=76867 RepID=A0A0C2XZK8_HEBCY|nr:glycoside hydrolase family 35 protein [Hebeloma cylindrosporum h7]